MINMQSLLGVVKSLLMKNDRNDKLALADIFEEIGDQEVPNLLRNGNFEYYAVFEDEFSIAELYREDNKITADDIIQTYTFNSRGEYEAFILAIDEFDTLPQDHSCEKENMVECIEGILADVREDNMEETEES